MNDRSGRPRRRRLRRPAPRRRRGDRRAGPPGDRPPLRRPSWSFCSRSGPPHVPWLEPDVNDRIEELAPSTASGAWSWCPIGFVSDHMEVIYDLDTEASATAEKLGLEFARAATAGRRPPVRRHGARPAPRAGRGRARRRRAARHRRVAQPVLGRRLPGRLLPQPPRDPGRRCAGRTDVADHVVRRAARPWPSRWPSRPPSWCAGGGARASRWPPPSPAPSTSSPRSTGPPRADLRPADGGPSRRRLPRRGGRQLGVDQRRGLGRRPHRRHRELPLRHPALRRLHRRRRGRRVGRRGGGQRAERRAVHRHPRRRSVPRRPPCSGSGDVGPARRSGWSAPASTTCGTSGWPSRRSPSPRCCTRSATSAGSARPPWTSARSRAAASTPSSRRVSTPGTWPPAGWSRPRPGGRLKEHPGVGGKRCVLCAPADGFEEFRDLVGAAGSSGA